MAMKKIFLWMAKVIQRQADHSAQVVGFANEVYESKILHAQGMVSGVPKDTTLVAIQLGHHRNKSYLLPMKIVALQPMPDGATMLYATNPDGSAIVGAVELTNDGKLAISTQQDDLLAILQETLSLLQELKTFGSPTSQAPSPDWVAKASALQSRLDAMAKYQ